MYCKRWLAFKGTFATFAAASVFIISGCVTTNLTAQKRSDASSETRQVNQHSCAQPLFEPPIPRAKVEGNDLVNVICCGPLTVLDIIQPVYKPRLPVP